MSRKGDPMRLWSLHPALCDRQGLVACWREGLLARKVLLGQTRGYKNHSQLVRFKACTDPVAAVDAYLHVVQQEATERNYKFNVTKLGPELPVPRIPVTSGQLDYELEHLRRKLAARSPDRLDQAAVVRVHPLFHVVEGSVEPWEKT